MSYLDLLRFPVGRFKAIPNPSSEDRKSWIEAISDCPSQLRAAVEGFVDTQYDTPYREGGWTVRQLVHHIYDSHSNAFIRIRLALTQDNPRINAYDQDAWAHLTDSLTVPAEISLGMIDGLHLRWVVMMQGMTADQFSRMLDHPESGPMSLDFMVQLYAWHCLHHVRHITALRERKGW